MYFRKKLNGIVKTLKAEKELISHTFSVYEHSSQAVDEFFVAYIKGWYENTDLQITDLISLFFNSEVLNSTKLNGEIVMMEQFLNSHEVPFSKIYLRISGFTSVETVKTIGRRMSNSRIIMAKSGSSNTTSDTLANDNLLYKVRTVFFEEALPTYSKQVLNIIKRAWLSKIDQRQFDSQNGLRVSVSIVNVAHYINNLQSEVLGFSYTVSVNGQDPESIPIAEPTYDAFKKETQSEPGVHLVFSPYNAYEIDRVYIVTELSDTELNKVLNSVLAESWNALNTHVKYVAKNRITDIKIIKDGLITKENKRLLRVSLTYLADGNVPNPIKFTKPTVSDLIPLLAKSAVMVYDDMALLPHNIVISNYNESLNDRLESAIVQAYCEENPDVNSDVFYVEVDRENSKRSVDLDSEARVGYSVGISDQRFDVTDIRTPSAESLQRAIRAQVPDVVFDQESGEHFKKSKESAILTNNVAIIAGSVVGAICVVALLGVVIAALVKRNVTRYRPRSSTSTTQYAYENRH
ncbi:hypothetical protein BpHYR1_020147 [Brachionus plicatilis]|uniref:Uncharacterized protein n=1 Tax=Brachionus plicatilis TaxID=10195 RepID=A0A3M7PXN3_BRAPC|nr:hypothetical protein BpHYR1_020147 [Brachionus plicatilis]